MKTLTLWTIFLLVVVAVPQRGGAEDRGASMFVDGTELTEKTDLQNRSENVPIKLKAGEADARLLIETDSPLSPYLGAVKKSSESPAGVAKNEPGKPWSDYHLETGVGLRVNEQTKLNLGYRFNETLAPSDWGIGELTEQGDINFSLEINFPF